MNYYDQLCKAFPDKQELLWLMKYPLHHHLYSYGNHSRISYERRIRNDAKIKDFLYFYYAKWYRLGLKKLNNSIVSSANLTVNRSIEEQGFNVFLLKYCLSYKSYKFLENFKNIDFNKYLSTEFEAKIIEIKEELISIFKSNNIRFLLLASDVTPLEKIAIRACQTLEIPTGVFLHGLPAEYDLIDNFSVDYTFVWGESIKKNYVELGCKKDIIVTGNPNYSGAHPLSGCHDKVVVISFCAGDAYDGSSDLIADRGLCIQYVYAVEKVLKEYGVTSAILRVHPHENKDWYRKFIDTEFYTMDTKTLYDTLSDAKFLVGPVSSVLIDTVSHFVPYYSYVITKEVNPHSWNLVPPFRKQDGLPIAYSEEELLNNLKKENYVKDEQVRSYYAKSFDVSLITEHFLPEIK